MASDIDESEKDLSSNNPDEDDNDELEEDALPNPYEYNIRFFDDDEESDVAAAAVVDEKKENAEEVKSDIEDEEEIEVDELVVSFSLIKINQF